MANVKVFYAQMCGACHQAMDYFKEKGIEFDALEVKWNGDGWEDSENAKIMMDQCGDVDFVPQIIVKGTHIKGWAKLEPMIESGEFQKLLNG